MSLIPTRSWRTPFLLFLIILLPLATSAMRAHWMITTTPDTIKDPNFLHFLELPLPILSHMIGGSFFCLVAILQFTPEIRNSLGPWHRRIGRLAIYVAMIAAVSGIWMVIYYPANPMTLPAMSIGRFIFGCLMAFTIIQSMIAVGRRDFANHRAWMFRTFAIATAGGTQGILIITTNAATGILTPLTIATMAWVGWIINGIVAEYLIRRANRTAPYRASKYA